LLIESKSDQDPRSLEGQDSPDGKGKLKLKRGIEVGHIFKLGRKYSESMKLTVQSENGNIHPEMGCYGIGISRIVAAAIEQSHDDKGIIWSKEISPYTTALVEINPKGEENLKNLCTQIYTSLKERGHEVLWDDRDQSAGVKFSDMELIGIPQMIIIGEKSFRENKVEFKMRGEDKIVSLIPDEVLNKIQ